MVKKYEVVHICNTKNYYLSDGWKNIDEDEKFDLIISNPPVHIGNQNCFDIIFLIFSALLSQVLFKES